MFEKPRRLTHEELIVETSVIVVVRGYEDGFSPDIRRSRISGIKHPGFVLKIL